MPKLANWQMESVKWARRQDKINIGIDKVTENVKWISEKMDKAEQIISGVAENAQTVLDSLKEASEKAEEVLGWLKAK